MILQHVFTRIELDIAVEDKASITCDSDCTTIDLSAFHIALIEVFIIVGIETTAYKELRYGNSATRKDGPIGAELGEAERFSCLAWTKFDQMIVALNERNHTHEIQ